MTQPLKLQARKNQAASSQLTDPIPNPNPKPNLVKEVDLVTLTLRPSIVALAYRMANASASAEWQLSR